MNCQAVQNQILALPDPRELPPALREHVLGCAECKAWAKQAARLEAILAQMPVPAAPGEKKETMLGDLMSADPVIQPMATLAQRPSFGVQAVRFLQRNATYVGGLAAAVLVAIGIYAMWPTKKPNNTQPEMTQNHPLLRKLAARDADMARANSTAKKLEVLNGMAEDISTDTRGMANVASESDLKQMAGWYERVVKDGVAMQADKLPTHMPPSEKTKLLESYAAKLNADAAESDKLAGDAPQHAKPALKRMADAAREGEKSLRAAAREGK